MALSGTRAFNLDAAELIEESFELIGHEARTGYDLVRARRSLNIMFKEWANRGINLWTVTRDETALIADQDSLTMNAGEIDVIDCAIRYDSRDYVLERITRADYLAIPDKDQNGRPTQLWVDRQLTPVIYFWPTPPDGDYSLITYRIQHLQDVDESVENMDTPSRFIPAAVAGLAFYMAMKIAPERLEIAKAHYDELLARAISEDTERASLFIYPSSSC